MRWRLLNSHLSSPEHTQKTAGLKPGFTPAGSSRLPVLRFFCHYAIRSTPFPLSIHHATPRLLQSRQSPRGGDRIKPGFPTRERASSPAATTFLEVFGPEKLLFYCLKTSHQHLPSHASVKKSTSKYEEEKKSRVQSSSPTQQARIQGKIRRRRRRRRRSCSAIHSHRFDRDERGGVI